MTEAIAYTFIYGLIPAFVPATALAVFSQLDIREVFSGKGFKGNSFTPEYFRRDQYGEIYGEHREIKRSISPWERLNFHRADTNFRLLILLAWIIWPLAWVGYTMTHRTVSPFTSPRDSLVLATCAYVSFSLFLDLVHTLTSLRAFELLGEHASNAFEAAKGSSLARRIPVWFWRHGDNLVLPYSAIQFLLWGAFWLTIGIWPTAEFFLPVGSASLANWFLMVSTVCLFLLGGVDALWDTGVLFDNRTGIEAAMEASSKFVKLDDIVKDYKPNPDIKFVNVGGAAVDASHPHSVFAVAAHDRCAKQAEKIGAQVAITRAPNSDVTYATDTRSLHELLRMADVPEAYLTGNKPKSIGVMVVDQTDLVHTYRLDSCLLYGYMPVMYGVLRLHPWHMALTTPILLTFFLLFFGDGLKGAIAFIAMGAIPAFVALRSSLDVYWTFLRLAWIIVWGCIYAEAFVLPDGNRILSDEVTWLNQSGNDTLPGMQGTTYPAAIFTFVVSVGTLAVTSMMYCAGYWRTDE